MKYKTKHRTKLIGFLKKNHGEHLTIHDIQRSLPDIPQATLYRLMDSLLEEGLVRKYVIEPNASCCYQYCDCDHDHHHFHLICEKCGKLIHLDCHEVDKLVDHIEGDHGFKVDINKVNLYGLCDECQKGDK